MPVAIIIHIYTFICCFNPPFIPILIFFFFYSLCTYITYHLYIYIKPTEIFPNAIYFSLYAHNNNYYP